MKKITRTITTTNVTFGKVNPDKTINASYSVVEFEDATKGEIDKKIAKIMRDENHTIFVNSIFTVDTVFSLSIEKFKAEAQAEAKAEAEAKAKENNNE